MVESRQDGTWEALATPPWGARQSSFALALPGASGRDCLVLAGGFMPAESVYPGDVYESCGDIGAPGGLLDPGGGYGVCRESVGKVPKNRRK